MKLRPEQEDAINHFWKNYNDNKEAVIFSIATGKGKSVISLQIIKKFLNQEQGNVLIICPTLIIRSQLFRLYSNHFSCILFNTDYLRTNKDLRNRVFLCCYPTYSKMLEENPNFAISFSLVIIDEIHKVSKEGILGKTMMRINQIKRSKKERYFKVGLTATLGGISKRKGILSLLTCTEKEVFEDLVPLYDKKEEVISLEPSSWRLQLLESLKGDLTNWLINKMLLTPKFIEPPVMTLPTKYPLHIKILYLLINKLIRLVHGSTPVRINNYYSETILKSNFKIKERLSEKTIKLFEQYPLFDERFDYLLSTSLCRRIIFVEDIKIGLEIASLLPESYLLTGKDKKGNKLLLKELSKKHSFNLVSTSVAEEGLNLMLDEVINFEVPSTKIKLEQRKGRIGRYKEGKVVYFSIKKTYGNYLLSKYVF